MKKHQKEIWVFGDYRNYFQNRVTLQLLAKAVALSKKSGARVCAVVFGHEIDEYVGEYIAHGAQAVYAADHPSLKTYGIDAHVHLMTLLVKTFDPEIILVGATCFGRELAPRLAKRLETGLTADCIELDIDGDGRFIQTAPAFGGNLLATIITPDARPRMSTVRPGIFQELPHDYQAKGEVIPVSLPKEMPEERVRLVHAHRRPERGRRIEDARIVVCGGRGMGGKTKFRKLFELARLLDGEVGATRPVVHSGWADHEALVGQAGKQIRPEVLFSFGVSGAIQHTAAITDARFIVAVNKNPNATMMKMADVAIVSDANQVCSAMIRQLKQRIRR